MSEIELKGCINCKHYEKNYKCRIFSTIKTKEPCKYWESFLDDVKEDDQVNHPKHYTDGRIEVIEYIEDKNLGFCLGNAIKYISRAGKKEKDKEIQDLRKATWYIERRIYELENNV